MLVRAEKYARIKEVFTEDTPISTVAMGKIWSALKDERREPASPDLHPRGGKKRVGIVDLR